MNFIRRKKNLYLFITLLLLLIGIRAYLPIAVRDYVNNTLDRIPEYDGRVADVDLHLWRGAYSIQDIQIIKTTGKVPVPFFESPNIDFSIEWKALIQGKLVGEIEISNAKLNFVSAPSEKMSQTEIDSEWLNAVKDLFPFRINRFAIDDSEVHFRDYHSTPNIDLILSDLNAVGKNFSNTRSATLTDSATIEATAMAEKYAPAKAEVKLKPAARLPEFDLTISLRDLDVKKLNDFLKAYASIDAEGGQVGFDIEMASASNKFKGVVKPILKNLQIFRIRDDVDNPLTFIWEGFVGLLNELFENQRHSQIATTIPFEGTLDNPEMRLWPTIGGVLENAFIKAIKHGNENIIDLDNLN